MHLNIFSGHLLGGCSSSGAFCSLVRAGGRSGQQPPNPPVLYELALKINYTAEVRGRKTKVDPSASGQVDSAAVQRVNALTVASITGAAKA